MTPKEEQKEEDEGSLTSAFEEEVEELSKAENAKESEPVEKEKKKKKEVDPLANLLNDWVAVM